MAKYEISEEEYRRFTHSAPMRPRKRFLTWFAALVIFTASLYFGQYVFALVWVALLVFLYITFRRIAPKSTKNRISNNPFALGPFDVEFECDSYTVQVGDTELQLSLSEFGQAHDLDDHYRLDHKSLFTLFVPKRVLSSEELRIIDAYCAKFPGFPTNQNMPDY